MEKYSAGLVSRSFWYGEFSKVIDLINQGIDWDEIKKLAVKDNFFKQSSSDRALRMYQTLKMRIDTLNSSYFELFPSLDPLNQKIVNLIAIMNTDRLFSEFMYESFRIELLLGDSKLYDYEVQSFFDRKQTESEQIAAWTDETVTRLAGAYLSYLRETGLLKDNGDYDDVIRPLMDIRLQDLMRSKNENIALASLLGR